MSSSWISCLVVQSLQRGIDDGFWNQILAAGFDLQWEQGMRVGGLRISSFRKSAYLRRVCTRFCSVLIFLFRLVPPIFSLLVSFSSGQWGFKNLGEVGSQYNFGSG